MEYEGQICRPPMEKSSFMLGVSVGCAYNRCKFCTLFKHLNHRLLPLSQIEKELMRIRDIGGNPKQVYLGDGNAFGMETPRLMDILEKVFHYFPNCEMVNMDTTVTDISQKTDAELHQLRESGIKRLYLGIESGLDDVLEFMKKDHNTAEAYREIERIQKAGFSFNAHIMTGISGAGRGLHNAEKLAGFFNRTHPERIINFSLFLHRKAPLYRDIEAGNFIPADEKENLQETFRLIELLETGPLLFDAFHDQLEFRVRGSIPKDKEKMLKKLENAIAFYSLQEPIYSYCS